MACRKSTSLLIRVFLSFGICVCISLLLPFLQKELFLAMGRFFYNEHTQGIKLSYWLGYWLSANGVRIGIIMRSLLDSVLTFSCTRVSVGPDVSFGFLLRPNTAATIRKDFIGIYLRILFGPLGLLTLNSYASRAEPYIATGPLILTATWLRTVKSPEPNPGRTHSSRFQPWSFCVQEAYSHPSAAQICNSRRNS